MTNPVTRLVLPQPVVRRLETAGIYCQTWVTIERQARADRWVLRGVESGGSAKDLGRYIAFFDAEGKRIGWLQRLDRITANGVHAVVVADSLLAVEMARVDQTYQLLIATHRIGKSEGGKRPPLISTVIYRGIDGQLPQELRKQGLTPEFFTRAGEVKPLPENFAEAVRLVTTGVSCINCRHCHALMDKKCTPAADGAPDVVVAS